MATCCDSETPASESVVEFELRVNTSRLERLRQWRDQVVADTESHNRALLRYIDRLIHLTEQSIHELSHPSPTGELFTAWFAERRRRC